MNSQIVLNKKRCYECRTFIMSEYKTINITNKNLPVHVECFNKHNKELKKLENLERRIPVDPSKSLSKQMGRPKLRERNRHWK